MDTALPRGEPCARLFQSDGSLVGSLTVCDWFLRTLTDRCWDIVTALYPDGRIRFMSAAVERVLGRPAVEWLGQMALDLCDPLDRGAMEEAFQHAFRGLPAPIVIHRATHLDGHRVWLETSLSPIVDPISRKVVDIVAVSRDVTERITHEQDRRVQEERFRDFVETAGDWFWEQGPDGRFTMVEAIRTGHDDLFSAAPGRHCDELGLEPVDPVAWQCFRADYAAHQPFRGVEFRQRSADGGWRFWQISGRPRLSADGEFLGYRGVASDITAQRQAEERAAQQERRLSDAIDALADGFAYWDADERLSISNYRLRDMMQCPDGLLVPGLALADFLAALARGGRGDAKDWIAGYQDRLRAQRMISECRHPDGRWYRVASARTRDGGIVTIWSDVTDRRLQEAELRAALEFAESASASKTDFVNGISHELRTPLNAILGFSELLQIQLAGQLTDVQRDFFDQIADAGQLLLDLVDDVLDLARVESGRLMIQSSSLTIGAMVERACGQMRRIAAQADVTLAILPPPDDVPPVEGDPQRVLQVLLNLVGNGIKYNRPGGLVSVGWQRVAGGRVRVLVKDTGIGIPPDRVAGVFETFNRLGREYGSIPGTGVGLALSRKLIEAMNGAIGFDSVPGTGSTFWFELPVS